MTEEYATVYTSVQLLQIAREGVCMSGQNTLQAIVGVVFSAFALEAVVNQLVDHMRDVDGRPVEAPLGCWKVVSGWSGVPPSFTLEPCL